MNLTDRTAEHREGCAMGSMMLHICMETDGAPSADSPHAAGDRWICECGGNFVYREGFNRAGYTSLEWWPAPAIPQPRKARRGLLFGPRQG